MKVTKKQFIGKQLVIKKSKNQNQINLTGIIIDETKESFLILRRGKILISELNKQTNNKRINQTENNKLKNKKQQHSFSKELSRIMKKDIVFKINGNIVDGNEIRKRIEDRIIN